MLASSKTDNGVLKGQLVMKKKVTMIEDSREAQLKFLESIPTNEIVELQAITVDPFFDEQIEQAITEFGPDLIILDLRLKRDENSGFRVLRQLRESSLKDVPIIVCSKYIGASLRDPNRVKALNYGALAALPKSPFPKLQDFYDPISKLRQEKKDSESQSTAGTSQDIAVEQKAKRDQKDA